MKSTHINFARFRYAFLFSIFSLVMATISQAATYNLADYQSPLLPNTTWLYSGRDWDGYPSDTRVQVISNSHSITTYTGSTTVTPYSVNVVNIRKDFGTANPDGSFTSTDDWNEFLTDDGFRMWGHDDDSESIRTDGGVSPGTTFAVGESHIGSAPAYENGGYVGIFSVSTQLLGIENVTVPAGTFNNCLHLRFSELSPSTQVWDVWLAEGIGQIRLQGISGNGSARLQELVQYSEPAAQGTISGTITTESPVGDWNTFQVEIYDADSQFITSAPVYTDGSYTTSAIASGTYYLRFRDNSNEFQSEWYGNFPGNYPAQDTEPVAVATGADTSGIDVSLHRVADAAERFYFIDASVSTLYIRPRPAEPITTYAYTAADVNRFNDYSPVPDALVLSFTASSSSPLCTGQAITTSYFRLLFQDWNSNGVIDAANEYSGGSVVKYTSAECQIAATPHSTGSYQLLAAFANGQNLTKTITTPAPYTLSELPPVKNLAASWDDSNDALTVSWTIPSPPASYPSDVSLEIRVQSYRNGHWLCNQVRIRRLQPTLTSFTLNKDMTELFNIKAVEQLRIEVRLSAPARKTASIARNTYNFDSKNGILVEAPLAMTLLDVNGDGHTGLEEAIYSLNKAAGQ